MKKEKLNQLNNLIYFTKEHLRTLSGDKENTLSTNISRWMKSGDLIRLKNGVYCTKESFNNNSDKAGYNELIANVLRFPSYVSMEYVLSKLGVLTEAIYVIKSVTLKPGRTYENITGTYVYHSIMENLFCGYKRKNLLGKDYLIAKKSKALFDFLYYKSKSLTEDFRKRDMVEELRLDMTIFDKNDFESLEKYASLSDSKKVSALIQNIIKNAPN